MGVWLHHNKSISRLSLTTIFLCVLVLQPLLPVISVHAEPAATSSGRVVINEVYPGSPTAKDQWVELYNTTTHKVSLSGWRINQTSSGALVGDIISDGQTIAPHGYFVLEVPFANQLVRASDALVLRSAAPAENNDFVADRLTYSELAEGKSFGLGKDGVTSSAKRLEAATKGATNNERCKTSLATECLKPEVPTLAAPADNGVKNGQPAEYQWQGAKHADHYIYESYHDAGLTIIHEHREVAGLQFERSEYHGEVIWWRVKAVSEAGKTSKWSNARKVTIDNEAPLVKNITEGDMSVVRGEAVFRFESTDEHPGTIIVALDGDTQSLANPPQPSGPTTRRLATITITVNLDTTTVADGPHQLVVFAIDQAGNRSEKIVVDFSVDNNAIVNAQDPAAVENLRSIPLPKTPLIKTLLGGEASVPQDIPIPNEVAVLSTQDSKSDHTEHNTSSNTSNFHKSTDRDWPVWLGLGSFASGVGWWLWLGRRRGL